MLRVSLKSPVLFTKGKNLGDFQPRSVYELMGKTDFAGKSLLARRINAIE